MCRLTFSSGLTLQLLATTVSEYRILCNKIPAEVYRRYYIIALEVSYNGQQYQSVPLSTSTMIGGETVDSQIIETRDDEGHLDQAILEEVTLVSPWSPLTGSTNSTPAAVVASLSSISTKKDENESDNHMVGTDSHVMTHEELLLVRPIRFATLCNGNSTVEVHYDVIHPLKAQRVYGYVLLALL